MEKKYLVEKYANRDIEKLKRVVVIFFKNKECLRYKTAFIQSFKKRIQDLWMYSFMPCSQFHLLQ